MPRARPPLRRHLRRADRRTGTRSRENGAAWCTGRGDRPGGASIESEARWKMRRSRNCSRVQDKERERERDVKVEVEREKREERGRVDSRQCSRGTSQSQSVENQSEVGRLQEDTNAERQTIRGRSSKRSFFAPIHTSKEPRLRYVGGRPRSASRRLRPSQHKSEMEIEFKHQSGFKKRGVRLTPPARTQSA